VTEHDPRAATFLESDLADDPFEQFERWFTDARAARIELPEAMTLATATRDGAPSARMVLLKEHGPGGFLFFTGYASRKGMELAANPRAALLFYWHELGRQVRLEGEVERLPREGSEEYFRTRPLGSRLGAWASEQSQVIAGRDALEARYDEAAHRFGDAVPLPPEWGGYRLRPTLVEFWQHRPSRLHDRLRYRLVDAGWVVERLAP
jgi:pyridoxamine 5'-phosphate oxidase